jgi:hypothetical protein
VVSPPNLVVQKPLGIGLRAADRAIDPNPLSVYLSEAQAYVPSIWTNRDQRSLSPGPRFWHR